MDEIINDETENDNLNLNEQMREQLLWLKSEHRRIDQEIDSLIKDGAKDMIKIQRMKKIKLSMKDQITLIENRLTPDIIA